jgi:hypothetical protein
VYGKCVVIVVVVVVVVVVIILVVIIIISTQISLCFVLIFNTEIIHFFYVYKVQETQSSFRNFPWHYEVWCMNEMSRHSFFDSNICCINFYPYISYKLTCYNVTCSKLLNRSLPLTLR